MKYKLLTIALLLFASGCTKDPDIIPYSEGQTFTLSLESFSDIEIGSTRSEASDVSVDRGFVFFYNGATGIYKGHESIEDLNLLQSGSIISFETDSSYSTSDKIIAIFNYDESAPLPDDFSDVSSENLSMYFPLSAEYLAMIEDDMNSNSYELGMPMYLNDFTDSDRAVREVYRSVARMELFIKQDLTIDHDSHTHSVGVDNLTFAVVNAISEGSVGASQATVVETCFDLGNFDNIYPYSLTEYSDSAVDTNNKVYLYPFPYATNTISGNELDATTYSEERFAIILKHSDTNIYSDTSSEEDRYYKLNLLDKATSTFFDVESNHNYRVVITAVNSRGYATLNEAYQMPPSNIEYEIYDDKGGLTYSNGQYAISMDEVLSYDEVLVYGANETVVEFNNIRYVLPDGGEMDSSSFDTNEIIFGILSDDDGLIIETTSDFTFDSEGKSALTEEGQSITITLSGEGECTIALRIKLGNLEMGRDEITIKKVATNGDGDGSFDAHPNHLELEGQEFVVGSWQSDDIDFGARASSVAYDECGDGGMVIYMGENATPTGYRTMDGYISGEYSINSYPVFSPKTRKGYYSYLDSEGETHKVMIQLDQLAPFYLGHFGNTASDTSLHHYDGLICEKIEEVDLLDWNNNVVSKVNGTMSWSSILETYYGNIYSDGRYHNLVDGLTVTSYIAENTSVIGDALAAKYCYMKNDINGDEQIDPDTEPINWYLPAQNQLMAMWINKIAFSNDPDYNLNIGDSFPYYWSCSEIDPWSDIPNYFSQYAITLNMLEGEISIGRSKQEWGGAHVRCVRGVD
ncbi:MAG: hypothetical protein SNG38_07440 [Rikenellaceae bacterium]